MTQRLDEESRKHIEQIAEDVLKQFEETASVANTYLANNKNSIAFRERITVIMLAESIL